MTPVEKPLVGVLIVSHGQMASALVDGAKMLLSDEAFAGVASVCVSHAEALDRICARLEGAAADVDAGAGIVVLVDLHGSTPANLAAKLVDAGHNAALISGVNLSMLIKVLSSDRRQDSPRDLTQAALETARRSLRLVDAPTNEDE